MSVVGAESLDPLFPAKSVIVEAKSTETSGLDKAVSHDTAPFLSVCVLAPVFTAVVGYFVVSAETVSQGMLAEVATVHVILVTPSTIVVVLSNVRAKGIYLPPKSTLPAPPSHDPAK